MDSDSNLKIIDANIRNSNNDLTFVINISLETVSEDKTDTDYLVSIVIVNYDIADQKVKQTTFERILEKKTSKAVNPMQRLKTTVFFF